MSRTILDSVVGQFGFQGILRDTNIVISTGGGVFAAEVERPLYFAGEAISFVLDSIVATETASKYRGLSTSLRFGRDDRVGVGTNNE